MLYRIVSGILGIVLVTAGGLKFHQLLTTNSVPSQQLQLGVVIASCELAFGAWLLTGYLPLLTRALSLGLFFGLLHIAVLKALEKEPSCGCFGRVPVPPWGAIIVDAVAVISLLAIRPATDVRTTASLGWRPWIIGGAVALSIALTISTVMRHYNRPTQDAAATPQSDRDRIEQAAAAIVANYDSLPPIRLETTLVYRNAITHPALDPQMRFHNKYLLLGHMVRRDSISQGDMPAYMVIQDGATTFQYRPDKRRGWVRGVTFVEPHPLDPRCFGLDNPAHDVAAWLRSLAGTSAEPRPTGLVVKGKDSAGLSVSVQLNADTSQLPVEVEYRYGDGSLKTFTKLSYQRHATGWVLATGERWDYAPGKAIQVGTPGWYTITTLTVERVTTEREGPTREAFDPVIPAGAKVWDEEHGHTFQLSDALAKGKVIEKSRQEGQHPHKPRWSGWIWAIVAGDVLMLAVIGIYRRRLGF